MKGFLLSPRRSGSSGLLLSLRRSLVGRVLGCLSVWSSLPAWRVCLHACGVGLSLICFWSISVPPVRGGTYFSLPPQRKVGKRKQLKPLMLSGNRSSEPLVAPWNLCSLTFSVSDKGVILPAALRAPKSRSENQGADLFAAGAVGFASAIRLTS